MKLSYLSALVLSTLTLAFLSGCTPFESNQAVIGYAAKALEDNQCEVFKSALAGQAQAEYQSCEKFSVLRGALSADGLTSLGPSERLSETHNDIGAGIYRTYQTAVFAGDKSHPAFYVTTGCQLLEISHGRHRRNDWDCRIHEISR